MQNTEPTLIRQARQSGVEKATHCDRAWFTAHRDRTHRLRAYIRGEYGNDEPDPAPPGGQVFTIVRQAFPGLRFRVPIAIIGDPPFRDDDALHQMFDRVVSSPIGTPFPIPAGRQRGCA